MGLFNAIKDLLTGNIGSGQSTYYRGGSESLTTLPRKRFQNSENSRHATKRERILPKPRKDPKRRWLGPQDSIQVDGYTLSGCLTYFSDSAEDEAPSHPSTIVTELPVARPFQSDPGYWPSYSNLTSGNRGAYLKWLSEGRRDPAMNIGLVFVYFYGLEWRVLVENKDLTVIRSELLKLLQTYGSNRSMCNYSSDLLALVHVLRKYTLDVLETMRSLVKLPQKRLTRNFVEVALNLQKDTIPLELVLEALKWVPSCGLGSVQKTAWPSFMLLFETRFQKSYPNGFPTLSCPNDGTLEYKWAAACQHAPLRRIKLREFLSKENYWEPLVDIWKSCAKELRSFANIVDKGDRDEAAIFEALPTELRKGRHPDYAYWADWFESKTDEDGIMCVPLGVLVSRTTGIEASQGKLTAKSGKALAEKLAMVGLALEPDPRVTTGKLTVDDLRVLYRPTEEKVELPSPAYAGFKLIVELCVAVAGADGNISENEWNHILSHLDRDGEIPEYDRERLRAFALYLERTGAELKGATQKKLSALTEASRKALAHLVVAIALADGIVTKQEELALRKIYSALGIGIAELERILCKTPSQASPSVAAVPVANEAMGDSVAPQATGVAINWDAVAELQAETNEVQGLLARALAEASKGDLPNGPSPDIRPNLQSEPVTQRVQQETSTPSESKLELPGLDDKAARVLLSLHPNEEIESAIFAAACKGAGLMPSAAIEIINEWADEHLEDFLIEGDGPFTFHWSLLKK